MFSKHSCAVWRLRTCGHMDDVGIHHCKLFCSAPEPLQTVQRAELWGVILALQARTCDHIGGDNLNVVRHVGRLLEGLNEHRPFRLIKDGDLLLLIKDMLSKRWLNTIRITKVEGHAGDERVPLGAVKQVDKDGNDRAD